MLTNNFPRHDPVRARRMPAGTTRPTPPRREARDGEPGVARSASDFPHTGTLGYASIRLRHWLAAARSRRLLPRIQPRSSRPLAQPRRTVARYRYASWADKSGLCGGHAYHGWRSPRIRPVSQQLTSAGPLMWCPRPSWIETSFAPDFRSIPAWLRAIPTSSKRNSTGFGAPAIVPETM